MKPRRTIYAADLFAGAGGTSTGLLQACDAMGLDVELLAINHWDTAVETHAQNHPKANHLCASLDGLDPSKVVPRRKLDLLVASPECVHFSTARGGKPMDDQSRASAWHVLHWAERLRVERILIENVREFQTWGPLGANGRPLKSKAGDTFRGFVVALESLGYAVEWRVLNCADYGDATTRKRLFISAVRGHRGRRPAWPLPSHAKPVAADLFGALPAWRPAREVIDWSLPGESIFARKRPLAPTTLRRIEEGFRRFGGEAAEPFLVLLRGTAAGQIPSTALPTSRPVPTLSAGGGHVGLVQPFLLQQQSGGVPREVGQPVPTVATDGAISLVQPFLIDANHGDKPRERARGGAAYRVRSTGEPLATITGSRGLGVVQSFVVKTSHRGGNGAYVRGADQPLYAITTAQEELGVAVPFILAPLGRGRGNAPQSIDRPCPTVLASRGGGSLVQPFLVPYYRTGTPTSVDAPAPTLTAKDRLGLVEPMALDIRFRMLQPHELAAAMSFPSGYRFAGNKSDVVRQIGNAVPVRTASALCAAALGAA